MIAENISECCGCGGCKNICPVNAITISLWQNGNRTAVIDKSKCIKCSACDTVCPIQNDNKKLFPVKVFAAWNTDRGQQLNSSSGGIAAAMMHYCLGMRNTDCYATIWERETGCRIKKIENDDDLNNAVGSKYIESQCEFAFEFIKESLIKGKNIVFIGLPCQCAAIRLFFNAFLDKILLVDLICHGGVPGIYFKQHLEMLEKKYNKVADKVTFRNPVQGYCLSLYEKSSNRAFYAEKMHSARDLYFLGFRENLIFKETCYQCQYANEKRFSDITIGDYSGLGTLWEYNEKERKVNCVLIMTKKGEDFIELLHNIGLISLVARPLSEPMSAKGNPQLRAPNKITKEHLAFIELYEKSGDFEKSIKKVLRGCALRMQFLNFLFLVYRLFRFVPRRLWWKVNGAKQK